jgi:hypothetical protein
MRVLDDEDQHQDEDRHASDQRDADAADLGAPPPAARRGLNGLNGLNGLARR